MQKILGILGIFVGMILVSTPAFAQNDNLIVSDDVMKRELREKYEPEIQEHLIKGGCTTFAPLGWTHSTSSLRYIDRISPTFDLGFHKKDIPLMINSEKFQRDQFLDKNRTVQVNTDESTKIRLLIFENTGPQNIDNLIIFTNFRGDDVLTSDAFIRVDKLDEPVPLDDPVYEMMRGDMEDDPNRSIQFPNKLGRYEVLVIDPNELFGEISVTPNRVQQKMETVFDVTFQKPMKKSNLAIFANDRSGNTMFCNVIDAIQVNDTGPIEEMIQAPCTEGRILFHKTTNDAPICLTESTGDILVKRGWAYKSN